MINDEQLDRLQNYPHKKLLCIYILRKQDVITWPETVKLVSKKTKHNASPKSVSSLMEKVNLKVNE